MDFISNASGCARIAAFSSFLTLIARDWNLGCPRIVAFLLLFLKTWRLIERSCSYFFAFPSIFFLYASSICFSSSERFLYHSGPHSHFSLLKYGTFRLNELITYFTRKKILTLAAKVKSLLEVFVISLMTVTRTQRF